MVKHWSRLPREAVVSPFLVILKTWVDTDLNDLLLLTLPWARVWTRWSLEVPSSISHTVILWFLSSIYLDSRKLWSNKRFWITQPSENSGIIIVPTYFARLIRILYCMGSLAQAQQHLTLINTNQNLKHWLLSFSLCLFVYLFKIQFPSSFVYLLSLNLKEPLCVSQLPADSQWLVKGNNQLAN